MQQDINLKINLLTFFCYFDFIIEVGAKSTFCAVCKFLKPLTLGSRYYKYSLGLIKIVMQHQDRIQQFFKHFVCFCFFQNYKKFEFIVKSKSYT